MKFWTTPVIVGFMVLLAACGGGGSSDGAGGDGNGAFARFAGTFNGTYDASVTDQTTGAVLAVDAGTVSVNVAADGAVNVTFDDGFSVAGRIDGNDRLSITLDVAPFIQNVGCNSGAVTVTLDFGIGGGATANGPVTSQGIVCQGVPLTLTGVVNTNRV